MAKRRMFSLDIIDTDVFMEMPQSSRLLYYELCMRADDDGFVSSPKKIMKTVGCSEDDFKVLITKQFIIPFDSGIVVIKHWKIHNYLRMDRYKETIYIDEKQQLIQEKNNAYELRFTNGIPNDIPNGNPGKVSIGKNRLVEDSISNTCDINISERNGNEEENQNDGERYGNREENLLEYLEKVFGRPLSSAECEIINTWEDNEVTRYAIKQADLARAFNVKYIARILFDYHKNGIKSVIEAEERDKKFREKKTKNTNLMKSEYEINKVYEVDGIKFKINSDGKREIL